MVVIRLARGGAKKRPFYHVVATDRRNRRDGRYIERLGYFNPVARGNDTALEIKMERVQYWLGQGAQPSERVQELLKRFEQGDTGPKQHQPKVKQVAAPKVEETPAESTETSAEEETKTDATEETAGE